VSDIGAMDRFDALANCVDALVFVTDLSMRMIYASSALARETGFTAADFQFPQADNPFIHRDDASSVAEFIASFAAGDARVSAPLENRFLDRWGRTHRYRSVISKVSHEHAPALLFVCSEIRRPSSGVDDRQYMALVESADDVIVRLDARGRFLFANRQTYGWLGYSAVELGRLHLNDVVSDADRDTVTDQMARCAASAAPARFEVRLITKGGQEVWAQAVLRSLVAFDAPDERLAILRDITAEKRAAAERSALEERMRELNETLLQRERLAAIGEMAAVMAHEIRNPLGVFFNAVGGLRRLVHGPADADSLLAVAWEEAERLNRLVADLLEFAHPYSPRLEPTDLAPIVRNAAAAVARDPSLPHVRVSAIDVLVPEGLPRIAADPPRLHRALVNLLANALQHVAPGGSVKISAERAGEGEVRISVYNDGASIPPEIVGRIFDPFFTTRAAGTGLGLAVVRRIVEDQGGRIGLDAREAGVSFSVWLKTSPPA